MTRVLKSALLGVVQRLILAPGASRSGITISAVMFSGLDGEAAARHGLGTGTPGFITSAITGFFTVKHFPRYLRRGSLTPFVIYGLVAAAVVYICLAVA